ncbi:hypothetical protein HPB50_008876 [Hyalomma asiaticum]|uniref:Uncharacterized protein n=1 Tax=Hyalomma asiaticum TaxID=266040 RepID=A0ACB7TES7_HYAAI|nr:hypothetical protein HPB50_008876 [Hyalomma asiaticum]
MRKLTIKRTISQFVQATRRELVRDVPITEYVRELHFTYCALLPSNVILRCAQYCYNLRELYCANCVVEPAELFRLLSLKLTCVTTLHWSLYDACYYESKLDNGSIRLIMALPTLPQLKSMCMVCVAAPSTTALFFAIWPRCPMLRHLHFEEIDEHEYFVPNTKVYRRRSFPLLRQLGGVLRRTVLSFLGAAHRN